jgi:hypothetical protein
MRMFSTKLRTNSPPSEPSRVPAPASDLTSKANRDAALRARGLLPPLKPNKDLSRLEQEQDQHIPVVNPVHETIPTVEGDTTKAMTAASLVKLEWEEKNRSSNPDLSRMKSFQFGGLPSPVPSMKEPDPTSAEPDTAVDTYSLLLSPIVNQWVDECMVPSTEDNTAVSVPVPPRNKPHLVLNTQAVAASDYLRSPQSPATHSKNDPSFVPLPPSPAAPSGSEPHLVPLPPSPLPLPRMLHATSTSESVVLDAQMSASSLPSPSSLAPPDTPKSLKVAPPVISLSPPPSASLDAPTHFSHSNFLTLDQTDFLTGSRSLDTIPSLDTTSQTITLSSLSTSESLSSTGNSKPNMLKVKVHHHNIPIIMESPVEDSSFSRDSVLVPDANDELPLTQGEEEEPSTLPQVRRGHTAPSPPTTVNPGSSHQTSKNPMKRGQTLDPSSATAAKQRLSILSSVRRSVISSLGRSKSTYNASRNPSKFDASHLPPSPTVSAPFAEQPQPKSFSPTRSLFSNRRTSDAGSVPRVAAAPTLHNRASILVEVNNIEDEETRRMTELAFMA